MIYFVAPAAATALFSILAFREVRGFYYTFFEVFVVALLASGTTSFMLWMFQ